MVTELPQSILFCCDHNAVRSPMAEGIMKKFYGLGTYVQSVGVYNDLEIDGFAISVCDEIQVELSRHKSRSFDEMAALGDDLSSFDLVVALSPASQRRALALTRFFHMKVAEALAMTMLDLYKNPKMIDGVRKEFVERKGDRVYVPQIPPGPPSLID